MKKLLIVGHGKFATGIQEAIKMIHGSHPDLFYIDFLEEDSEDILNKKITSIINDNNEDEFLIICDLPGGTPFNISVKIINTNPKIKVVAGVNIGAILEVLHLKDDLSIEELAKNIVEISKKYTLYFEKDKTPISKDSIDGGI